MGRLLFISVCLIAMAVIVLKNPETLDHISSVVWGGSVSRAFTQPVGAEAKSPEKSSKKNAKSARGPSNPSPSRVSTESEGAEVLQSELSPSARWDPSLPSVKTDSAPVYSFNSPRSPVVEMLMKGERVESSLEVIDSGGSWILIRSKEQKRAGFVRAENLERNEPVSRNAGVQR